MRKKRHQNQPYFFDFSSSTLYSSSVSKYSSLSKPSATSASWALAITDCGCWGRILIEASSGNTKSFSFFSLSSPKFCRTRTASVESMSIDTPLFLRRKSSIIRSTCREERPPNEGTLTNYIFKRI